MSPIFRPAILLLAAMLVAGPAHSKTRKDGGKSKKPSSSSRKRDTGTPLPLLPPTTAPITIDRVFAEFGRYDREISALSASFKQTLSMDESSPPRSVEGTVEYQKPDRLRIEHLKPERQTVVSDGQSLWIWRHSAEQVIQTSLADWKDSEPLARGLLDFGNYASLKKRYNVALGSVSPPDTDGHRDISLKLTSRHDHADFVLDLTLSTRNYFPTKASLHVGQILIESTLDDIRINPDFARSRFEFTPPKGVELFENFRPVRPSPRSNP